MAGIIRHLLIGCVASLSLLFFNLFSFKYILVFILGNIIPDLIFVPFFLLIFKFNIKKMLKSDYWNTLSKIDETVTLIMAMYLFILFSMLGVDCVWVIVFGCGVLLHIIVDLFIKEKGKYRWLW